MSVGNWAQTVRPAIDADPPQPPPQLPDHDTTVRAKVAAYASSEVKSLCDAWMTAVVAVRKADNQVGLRLGAQGRYPNNQPKPGEKADGLDPLTPWIELDDKFRPAEATARTSLSDQIASELT